MTDHENNIPDTPDTDDTPVRSTTQRRVVADNGKTYTVPDWAPKRVRLDRHGRPELLMNPALFGAPAQPSSVRGPRDADDA